MGGVPGSFHAPSELPVPTERVQQCARFKVLAAAAASILLLAGCGAGGSGDANSTGTLIVYTNSNADGRAEWLKDKAATAGYKIEVVGAGGGETTNKLIAEKNNPVADVVFGLNNMYYEQLKTADAIQPFTPVWSGEVDASLADPAAEKAYWPVVQQGILLAYNADAISAADAPKDWTDLWTKPQFKDRYEHVTGLGGATTQLMVAGVLNRYKDDKGTLGVSNEGWDQIKAFFQNGKPAVKDQDLFARMAKGDLDMGQIGSSSIPDREQKYNVKAGVMAPEIGVPFAVEQVALVKGTKKKDQAEKFINWFGSADLQGEWAQQFSSMPVNKGAIAKAKPEVVMFHENLKHQDIDWKFAQTNIAGWIEKIELEYVK